MNESFNFKLRNVQIECANCKSQLEGETKFGLGIVECGRCGKYSQVTSQAQTTLVKTPIRPTEL